MTLPTLDVAARLRRGHIKSTASSGSTSVSHAPAHCRAGSTFDGRPDEAASSSEIAGPDPECGLDERAVPMDYVAHLTSRCS